MIFNSCKSYRETIEIEYGTIGSVLIAYLAKNKIYFLFLITFK